jgi:hypothetical protein
LAITCKKKYRAFVWRANAMSSTPSPARPSTPACVTRSATSPIGRWQPSTPDHAKSDEGTRHSGGNSILCRRNAPTAEAFDAGHQL